ncbi:hypothetical protein [Estrella lausannensis]|uniref:Uncharacterized protein n=1 Tax=Estrella lausannensis TaxID=483423 RepID=A0A0H5DPL3_9BACT|nr:hypothetical protein [Estrella lausannensis]CRX38397.1 hypothetical protein ELAC_1052 [Estrella lausannensis]
MNLFGVGNSQNDNWIQGLARDDHPLMQSPEDFMQLHPTWENALHQYFSDNPDMDCPANRAELALFMQRKHSTVSHPQVAIQEFGASARWVHFINNAEAARNNKNSSVALTILKVIGQIFLNIVTLGLYGVASIYLQQKAIVDLSDKKAKHESFVAETLIKVHNLKRQVTEAARQVQHQQVQVVQAENNIQQITVQLETLPGADPHLLERLNEEKSKLVEAKSLFHTVASSFDADDAEVEIPSEMATNGDSSETRKGWVKPLYTVKATDITSAEPRSRPAVNGCSTMEELLTAHFDLATRELLQKNGQGKVKFNKSSKLLSDFVEIGGGVFDKKHGDAISAIYKWMAYKMLMDAGVKKSGKDHISIVLNESGLKVSASQPYWVSDSDVIFSHHDGWTPPLDPPSNGVDPVSAYYLLHGMNAETRSALEALILDPMTPHESDDLKKAKAMKGEKNQRAEAIKNAELLIADIASALQRRYQSSLDDVWGDFFNDDDIDVYFKEPKQAEAETVEDDEEAELKKIVSWNPLELPLAFEDEALIADLERTRQQIAPVWNKISDCLLTKYTDNSQIKTLSNMQGLTDQYWWMHLGINSQGCLFSALAGVLLQGAKSKSDISPQRLKNFIASYLEAGAGERLYTFINAETKQGHEIGWSWNIYADFLKGKAIDWHANGLTNRSNYQMGDLEIELLCRALGLHVEVFCNGGAYSVKDGRITSTRHYGAINAPERITLFCSNGHSWYALFPKVRASKFNDPSDLKRALNYAKSYWGENDGIEYGSWHSFKMPPTNSF